MTQKDNNLKIALTYDDVLLVPQYSDIESRKFINIKTKFSKNVLINIPIVSANMDTVTESKMAIAIAREGGIGVIHRFLTIEEQVAEIKIVKDASADFLVAAAVGIKDGLERARALVGAGANALVIDIAHGHHKKCIDLTKELKKEFQNIDVVAGNVATLDGAKDLIEAGADAIKVGIGPGAACSTRIVAGAGVPQFSAVCEISIICHKYGIPLIADGGIKNSGDVAKAMGAGASSVMIGNIFAGTLESPGEYYIEDGHAFKLYRGLASRGASADRQSIDANKDREDRAPEGISFHVRYRGELKKTIRGLVDGLQSGMSYSGAVSIESFWERAKFVQMTNAGLRESSPRNYQS